MDKHNLDLILRSHFPIIVIETHDEQKAIKLLRQAASDNSQLGRVTVWDASKGLDTNGAASGGFATDPSQLRVEGIDYQPSASHQQASTDPEVMLKTVKETLRDCLLVLPDFHSYLENPLIVRLIKEIAQQYYVNNVTVVLISHAVEVPDEIERMCTHFELSMPSKQQIHQIILDEAKVWSQKNNNKVKADREAVALLANNLVGLTVNDARRFIRRAIYDDGAITHSDVSSVMQAKYKMISKDSALNYEYDTASFADVGGFEKLKSWLKVRKAFFIGDDGTDDFDIPKGMLLLGVQGCGKSLAAKAVAGSWGVPLLKMDIGALFNKYIGETEKNIREALTSAEMLAPCVLWVDEIEKGMQTGSDETGTSGRVLATLLTWMAENNARVFIVATSNDVTKLPPELMRKGRLDEIFFVDLPGVDAREAIFKLHLAKRNYDENTFDINALANACDGFSGAEIEQVIVSARYLAHSENSNLNNQHLLQEISSTRPLSIVRSEDIEYLRAWAKDRTVTID